MTAAVDILASQATVLAASLSAPDIRVSQAFTLTAARYPAAEVRVSQAFAVAAKEADTDILLSQAFVLAAVKGRTPNHHIRAWTFSLDGHDFYVLQLGEIETLVYDTTTQKWHVWASGSADLWNLQTGINWIGSKGAAAGYGTNIIVGHNTYGALYFLNPLYPYDDDPVTGTADRVAFQRVAHAQLEQRGVNPAPCYGVVLTGSFGDVYDDTLTAIDLLISDDAGRSYVDCGTVNASVGDYAARVEWGSLGMIFSPGRMFKLVDSGALVRIDTLEMIDGVNQVQQPNG